MSEPKVTLAHKKSLKDNEPGKVEVLAKLKALTGADYEFVVEPSIDAVIIAALKQGNTFIDKVGECLYSSTGYLNGVYQL